jgi:two-component system, OmpR family, sensor kinase
MTLRRSLLIGMGAVAAVLLVAAVLIARFTHSYLLKQVDDQLRMTAPRIPELADESRRPDLLPPPDDRSPDDGSPRFSPLYIVVLNRDGPVDSGRAPDLSGDSAGAPVIDVERAYAEGQEAEPEPYTVASVDVDSSYRIMAVYVPASDSVVVVGHSLADLDAAMDRLVLIEAVAVGLVLVALGAVTVWVIRHGVRPVKRMTATATAIAGGDLSHRVDAARPGTEAAELGDALNTMLGRIQEAFDERADSEERLRQFVADASHELRSPVTSIRGYAELYRRGGLRAEGDLGQAMQRMEQEATRMGGLIDDLLLLARLDQGRPLDQATVDLTVLAADAVADAAALAPSGNVTLQSNGPVEVAGDEHRLRQVVANLVTNAIVHTPPGTPVVVSTEGNNGRRVLTVHDDGPGMPADVADHAFERFWRADPSRARHHGGAGLGLAIVQAIVLAHGGTVGLTSRPGDGTTVTVDLPPPAHP